MEISNDSNKRKLDQAQEEPPKKDIDVAQDSSSSSEPIAKKARIDETQQQLADKIRSQIEFYFSDSNFRRDKWMIAEAANSPEGYIAIERLATFPRLKAMTTDIDFITEVIRTSDQLAVSNDGKMVKRIHALPTEDTSTVRSIYVQGVPEEATIDTAKEFFSQFGKVLFVRLFRNRETSKNSGDAYIEFDAEAAVQKACDGKLTFHEKEITVKPKLQHVKEIRKKRIDERKKENPSTSPEEQEKKQQEDREKAKDISRNVVHLSLQFEGELNPEFNKWDIKGVFEELVSAGNVKFVEYETPQKEGFIRLATPEYVAKAIEVLSESPKTVKGVTIQGKILEGEAQEEYIRKYLESRQKAPVHRRKGGKRGGGKFNSRK